MKAPAAQVRRGMPIALRDGAQSQRRGVPWFLLAISFLGFLVALYLALLHYRGVLPNCYVVRGCDVVQTSRYSAIFGVPIALFGTLYFALMFYLGIGLLTGRAPRLVMTYKVLAFAGALAAVPLFLIQAVVLRAFCTYCLVIEVVLLLMWGASFLLKSAEREERIGPGGSFAEPVVPDSTAVGSPTQRPARHKKSRRS